ncbi:MAG: DUF2029 domain-containing protein [Chloroflexota bacterium]|nr:DUF2029 domain-containing protein [Chloroflexota bacterium]
MRSRGREWRGRLATYGPFSAAIAITLPLLWPLATYPGDHFTLWAAGHIVATGGSPYVAGAWSDPALDAAAASGLVVDMRPVIAACCAVLWTYPPWTGLALAPFGALPVEIGVPLFHFVSLAAAIAGAVGLGRSASWHDPRGQAVGLVLLALFEPFILGARGGHFVGVLLLGVWLVQHGLVRERTGPLVVGALLLSLKPHLVLGLAVIVLVILVRRRRWSALGWIAGATLPVAAISFLAYPDAFMAMSRGSAERATGQGATTWTLVAGIFGTAVPAVVVVFQVGLLCACVLAARLTPPSLRTHATVALSLVASLALVPYVQDHDQLLLVPAMLVAIAYRDPIGRGRRWYLGLIACAFVLVPWVIQIPVVISDATSLAGLVPFVAAVVTLLGAALLHERSTARMSPAPQ